MSNEAVPEISEIRFLLQSASNRQVDEIDPNLQTIVGDIHQCLELSECDKLLRPKLLRLIHDLELQSRSVNIGSVLWNLRQDLISKIPYKTTDYYVGSYNNGFFKLLSQPRMPSNVIKILVDGPLFEGFTESAIEAIKACNATHVLLAYIGDGGSEMRINEEPDIVEIHTHTHFQSSSQFTKVCIVVLCLIGLIFLVTHIKKH